MKKVQLNVRIDENIATALRERSHELRVPLGDAVEEAILLFLHLHLLDRGEMVTKGGHS